MRLSHDGVVLDLQLLRNGAADGLACQWDEAGQLAAAGRYTRGVKVGVWTTFSATGEATRTAYVDGKPAAP